MIPWQGSWSHDIKTIIIADELAKDVAVTEALLERHQEHRVCILIPFPYQHDLNDLFISVGRCQRK